MKWYEGPIHEAISKAKLNQKIFLVFVEGKDEISKTMSSTYNNSNITETLQSNCIAIRLATDSEQFKQFSQIYPVIVVPSSFFIGNDGIPLEVVGGNLTVEEFSKKILNVVEAHQTKTGAVAPSLESLSTSASSSQISNPLTIPEPSGPSRVPEAEEIESSVSLEEKVERAKQLVEERRLQKLKEEQELAKVKELEHRRVGKEIQSAREKKQAREMAEWAQQRKKERDDDKLARERVKAQIAQDRADRAARFQNQSGEAPPKSETPAAASNSTNSEVRQRAPLSSSDRTRIQFRLPNATTRNREFQSNALLEELFTYVDQTIQPGFSSYSLATTFSRQQFTRRDGTRTLSELELVPSAVLLIIPTGGSISAVSSNFSFWPILYALISPLVFVWNTLLALFRSPAPSSNPSPPNPVPPPRNTPPANNPSSSSTSSTSPSNRSSPPGDKSSDGSGSSNKNKGANNTVYKRDGNIHRLANDSMDDDDENNTWNGNSTQQL